MSTPELRRVLALERDGDDVFTGPAMDTDVFVRTFGGHLAAQALTAASATVEDEKTVHSLHSYFLAGGDADAETQYRVRRLRDGRSFSARSVEAWQAGTLLYTLTASFQRPGDDGPQHAEPMPVVANPESIPAGGPIPSGVPGAEKDFREWDIRLVPPDEAPAPPAGCNVQYLWVRYREPLGAEAHTDSFRVCALTYMSDMTLLYSAMKAHPGFEVQLASLDHSIWFFRPVRVTDWLLYQQHSPSATGGRALTQGRLFTEDGELVALVTQEGLARQLRAGATQVPMRGN